MLNYVGWHSYKVLAFDYAQTHLLYRIPIRRVIIKMLTALRGGAQYKTCDKMAVRALGGGYTSTAVKDGYVTPEVPDANRYYLTGWVLVTRLPISSILMFRLSTSTFSRVPMLISNLTYRARSKAMFTSRVFH
jgi:hypothetical protein